VAAAPDHTQNFDSNNKSGWRDLLCRLGLIFGLPAFHGSPASLTGSLKAGQRLGSGRDDHSVRVLGPHTLAMAWVVRAWMPEAQSVALVASTAHSHATATPTPPLVV